MDKTTKAARPAATDFAATFTATEAKAEFGRVLETALQRGPVVITRHHAPKAVLISVAEYDALARPRRGALESLSREFDAMFERMQTPKSRVSMKAAFASTPRQLGHAAVAAARKRG